jgi:cell wall-associated NlpC family hydrolase
MKDANKTKKATSRKPSWKKQTRARNAASLHNTSHTKRMLNAAQSNTAASAKAASSKTNAGTKYKRDWKRRSARAVRKAVSTTAKVSSATRCAANKILEDNGRESEEEAVDAGIDIINKQRLRAAESTRLKKKPIGKKQAKKAEKAYKTFWKNKRKVEAMKGAANSGTQTIGQSAGAISKVGKALDKAKALLSRTLQSSAAKVLLAVATLAILMVFAVATVALPLASALTQTSVASSYATEDSVIIAVDNVYTSYEAQVEDIATAAANQYPGYDEYRYVIDEIGHNPYELAALLTARYGEYSVASTSSFLKEILNSQYSATTTASTETRTRTTTDASGNTTEEEYSVSVLTVTLTNGGIDKAAQALLTEEELVHYALLVATNGNRDDLFSGTWPTSSDSGYSIPPEALSDSKFAAMIKEAEKYLGYPYVWGGSSPSTSFDCSGFVSWVINASGVGSVGRQTAEGLRQTCAYVSAADAKPGDLIFFQNTYPTSGASHVGIYVGNGKMIHCGNPIQYTSIETSYWQSHFLSFGRIK